MPGQPKIYVDFNTHDPESRFYVASLHRFPNDVDIRFRFVATDHEDFDDIECEVVLVDRINGRAFVRPVNSEDIPGTYEPDVVTEQELYVRSDDLIAAGAISVT